MIISCQTCGGDGTTSAGESCYLCDGDGEIDLLDPAFKRIKYSQEKMLMGQVWSAILRPDGVFHSYEILECLDATEYNALTEGSQNALSLLLSCGLVDLNDGKIGRLTLWIAFGAESTTVTNLLALIAGE